MRAALLIPVSAALIASSALAQTAPGSVGSAPPAQLAQAAQALPPLVGQMAQAEAILNANPQQAITVARQILQQARAALQANVNPAAAQQLLTTAARIFASPAAQRVQAETVGELATLTVQIAQTALPPAAVASIAGAAVTTAERLLATSPNTAVDLAGVALQAVQSQPPQQAAPQQSLNVAVVAARILVAPTASVVTPERRAGVMTQVVALATSPVVYAASPTNALQAMANAYTASRAADMLAASPGTSQALTQQLTQFSADSNASQVNPSNSAQVGQILGGAATIETTGARREADLPPPRDETRVFTASPT
ncbi:MAG: hypothetical protein EAZ99_19120 [Alphaproteobacteria bacterium]|nr:MAG: hypothetical protein EAZ99_19120 [Alphaproteobacteria bacterium]